MVSFYLNKTKVIKSGVIGIQDHYIVMTDDYKEFVCFMGYNLEGYVYDIVKDYNGAVVFDEVSALTYVEAFNSAAKILNINTRLMAKKVKSIFRYDFSLN
jgi:hypothetical protein